MVPILHVFNLLRMNQYAVSVWDTRYRVRVKLDSMPKMCYLVQGFIHTSLLCCGAQSLAMGGHSGNRTANLDAVLALLYSAGSCQ